MHERSKMRACGVLGVVLAVGCGNPDKTVEDAAPLAPTEELVGELAAAESRALDILFVIDNSGSMEDEQEALVASFPRLIDRLAELPRGLPDLHIGVISTDLGTGPFAIAGCNGSDGGRLEAFPRGACEGPADAFIRDEISPDGTRSRNFSGALADVFSCIAPLGIDGCGFEQPLEAMRLALDGTNPDNAGFLRPDAALAVVILSDEDDCSLTDFDMLADPQATLNSELGPLSSFRCFEFGVECDLDDPRPAGVKANCRPRQESRFMPSVDEYAEFLRSLKAEPGLVFVLAITGDLGPVSVSHATINGIEQAVLDPSCERAVGQNAAPGIRHAGLVDAFPGRAARETICNADLGASVERLGELVAAAQDRVCLSPGLHDADADAPGVQPQCRVEVVAPDGTRTELPACDNAPNPDASSNLPCHVIAEGGECGADGLGLTRHGALADLDARVEIRCLVD